MPNKNKARGYRHEVEVAGLFEDAGFKATRMWGSDGRSRGHHKEVDVLVEGESGEELRVQCKIQKRPLSKNVKPSENVDLQIIRADYDQNYVVLPLSTFLEIYRAYCDTLGTEK